MKNYTDNLLNINTEYNIKIICHDQIFVCYSEVFPYLFTWRFFTSPEPISVPKEPLGKLS